jgi:hypothetical protein
MTASVLRSKGNNMARAKVEWTPTEVGTLPDVLRLAEQVRDNGEPRLLTHDGQELAVLVPVELARQFGLRAPRTEADRQAFHDSFGGWAGLVDTDQLAADIYRNRGPVECPSDEE